MRGTLALLALLALAMLAGCSADTRTYSVSVRNNTPRTVTLVLTKTAGPVEDRWASAEQIAEGQSSGGAPHGMAVVGPGRSADVSNISGKFPGSAQAVLRVYGGEPSYGDMLKIVPGRQRADFTLSPGRNDLVVRSVPAGLVIEPRPGGH